MQNKNEKENILLTEIDIFDNLKNSFKISKIKTNTSDWGLVTLNNFSKKSLLKSSDKPKIEKLIYVNQCV